MGTRNGCSFRTPGLKDIGVMYMVNCISCRKFIVACTVAVRERIASAEALYKEKNTKATFLMSSSIGGLEYVFKSYLAQ